MCGVFLYYIHNYSTIDNTNCSQHPLLIYYYPLFIFAIYSHDYVVLNTILDTTAFLKAVFMIVFTQKL